MKSTENGIVFIARLKEGRVAFKEWYLTYIGWIYYMFILLFHMMTFVFNTWYIRCSTNLWFHVYIRLLVNISGFPKLV